MPRRAFGAQFLLRASCGLIAAPGRRPKNIEADRLAWHLGDVLHKKIAPNGEGCELL